jgi:glycosyltransferase involved in cell wall biosynthesis
MRVEFLLYNTLAGGTEWASVRLMRTLRERGYSFGVISLTPAGPLKALLEGEGIPCREMPPGGKGGWRNLLRLIGALRATRPEAVILANHNPIASVAAALARVPRRLQVIHSYHRGLKHRWEWKLIYWLSCLCQHHVVFVSNFVRDEATAMVPGLATRSSVIHNIAPPARVVSTEDRALARRRLGLPLDVKLVGNAGRHVAGKRFDVFLEVAARVAAPDPQVQFLLAGAGPLTEALKAQAHGLQLDDRVHWRPWLDSMEDFYAALDVLLFNSDADALGLMVLEAMAHGVPVVASVSMGGLPELIESEAQGFLLRSHDVDRLAEQVMVCLGAQGSIIGAAGRERSQRYGAPSEVASRFAELLGAS